MKKKKIGWLPLPEEHDYPAAESYLHLILNDKYFPGVIVELRNAPIKYFKAKDIFRASGLSLLGVSNSHIKKNIKKINKGVKLSPILLLRKDGKVIIADGYHRLCAVYTFNEDEIIPCKIIG